LRVKPTTQTTPQNSAPILARVLRPFQEFSRTESAGGIVLLACTAIALVWANSPWAESYVHLWETHLQVGADSWGMRLSLHHWINDGLMTVFFLLVGLEIKREILVGELASLRRAAFPIAAAVGGMVVPALIYVSINVGTPAIRGWGIPMATDIAFALGVMAMIPRTPLALKVFLAALAIVDDIGAVLVIAIFYTAQISVTALAWSAALVAFLMVMNVSGFRHPAVYAIPGVLLWVAVQSSGIHATIAGVLLALTIPARTRINARQFLGRARGILDEFGESEIQDGDDVLTNPAQQEAIHALEETAEDAGAPLLRMEDNLHTSVAFVIMPLFALSNAGVSLSGSLAAITGSSVTLGVLAGLVIGKPLGITLFAWLSHRLGFAALPEGVAWSEIHATSWIAGIGFTMSLFIAGLAFPSDATIDSAKIGILAASLLAGVTGYLLSRRARRRSGAGRN
jgi:NhaA family Na+:H+ antiporter